MHVTVDTEILSEPEHLLQLTGQGSQVFIILFVYVIGKGQTPIHRD